MDGGLLGGVDDFLYRELLAGDGIAADVLGRRRSALLRAPKIEQLCQERAPERGGTRDANERDREWLCSPSTTMNGGARVLRSSTCSWFPSVYGHQIMSEGCASERRCRICKLEREEWPELTENGDERR